jgi:hypothetical protein
MKSVLLTTLLLIMLCFSMSILAVQPTRAADSDQVFSDDFNGSVVDDSKWMVLENGVNMSRYTPYGGLVNVTNSCLALSSNGSAFPIVQSKTNPFPASGDFAIQFDITYAEIFDWGDGVMFSHGIAYVEPPANNYSGTGTWKNRVFTLWAHDLGHNQCIVYIEMFNSLVWKTNVPSIRPASETFYIKLVYLGGVYSIYVDGAQVGSVVSNVLPDTITLGSPAIYFLPHSDAEVFNPNHWGWSSFKIDRIGFVEGSRLTVSASAKPLSVGYKVDIAGNLTTLKGDPLSGQDILLSYHIPRTSIWTPITSTTTDSSGKYQATWLPSATGNFAVKAEWAGNEAYVGAVDVKNVSVIQGTGSETLFMAESNSTLSSVAFNSTSREISFTVSGENGTYGYVRFQISKTLITNMTDFKIFIDGAQISFTLSKTDSAYILYFEYHHSTHDVSISLPSANVDTIPEFPSWILLPLLAAAMLVAIAFNRRRQL